MGKVFLLRWRTNGKEFCKIVHRDDLYKKILALTSKNDDVYDSKLEDFKEIIKSAESVFWDTDIAKDTTIPFVLEYWYADGNTSEYTVEPEEIHSDEVRKVLEKVLFERSEEDGKKEIPDNIQISWLLDGNKKEKKVNRKEVLDIFSPYIYTDAMNNGIAKRIMAIIPYSLGWYIAWDNDAEINSLFYEFGEIGFKRSISIPGIHRKNWRELKKLCDM